MNEHLPYEDELVDRLADLPLPNEDISWEDMKRRLERDNDNGPVILPVLRGCGGFALLLLVLIFAFLFFVDPANWFHNRIKKEPVKTSVIENKEKQNGPQSGTERSSPTINQKNKILTNDTDFVQKNISSPPVGKDAFEIKDSLKNQLNFRSGVNVQRKYHRTGKNSNGKFFSEGKHDNEVALNNTQHSPLTKRSRGKMESKVAGSPDTVVINSDPPAVDHYQEQTTGIEKDPVSGTTKANTGLDTIKKKPVDTLAAKEKTKPDTAKKQIFFSAGIGMHQLLPVAGQKTNPYNSLGRTGSLGDYIPSLYLRMNKDKKWFLQSEFRYGAPQYTKEIEFSQKIIDSIGATKTTSNSTVKKTFYHQLPLSFNYFVLPGFSVGTGIAFNRFNSAVVQQDVHLINAISQVDSIVNTGVVNQKKADSNFVTTYIQALVEAQFQWRRFSIGARYSFGIQPYLKFKLPGGEMRKEKNSSLQLFIRYEFWRSRKK